MAEVKVTRVEEDDPTRCQAIAGKNQCPYGSAEGSKYCPLHSGSAAGKKKKQRDEVDQYRLNGYKERLKELANHPKIKSLRDEIGILKMTLESVLNMCPTPNDLYLQHQKIADLVGKIEKVVVSCNTIEHKNGQLLDKTEVLKIVDAVLQILTLHIEDADTLRAISDEIFKILEHNG